MRRPVTLSVLFCLLFVPPWSGEPRRNLYDRRATLRVERVALYPGTPDRNRLGALDYLGGVRLIGNQPAFGGFSSLLVKGDAFTLLSDGGAFVRFRLDADWRVSDIRFGDLPDGPGEGWKKADRDSESMTADPKSGDVWVGFENSNQIWRYTSGLAAARGHAAPPAMAWWGPNTGAEAMVRLRAGRFVILAEQSVKASHGTLREGLVFAADPVGQQDRAFRFSYRPPTPQYSPTDVAELPDGRLILLSRAFVYPFGFSTTVSIIDPHAIRPGAVVSGCEIARFDKPALADNFEGIVVTREGRDTILWIVSDDNQSILQQSLLLKFRLDPARLAAACPRGSGEIRPRPAPKPSSRSRASGDGRAARDSRPGS